MRRELEVVEARGQSRDIGLYAVDRAPGDRRRNLDHPLGIYEGYVLAGPQRLHALEILEIHDHGRSPLGQHTENRSRGEFPVALRLYSL